MAFVAGPVTQQFIWGPRGTATKYDVYMPQRVVSSDGQCAIEVEVEVDKPWDTTARASQLQVQNAVAEIINNCMSGKTNPTGGYGDRFDDDGNLSVRVFTADEDVDPTAIQCYGSMPPFVEPSCRYLLNHMPWDDHSSLSPDYGRTRFGPSSDPTAKIHMPHAIVSRDRRCALIINTNGPTDTDYWWDFWQMAVWITGVCARQGKRGRHTSMGSNGHLSLDLINPSSDISTS